MSQPPTSRPAHGLRGVSQLAFDAVEQLTGIVEAMHANIAAAPFPLGRGTDGRTRGVTGLVYGSIRLVNAGARAAFDRGIRLLPAAPAAGVPRPRTEAWLGVLNGVIGDHLEATGNPLAIPMQLRRGGEALVLERASLASALPDAGGKLLVLVHGLCMHDRQWSRNGHDHGEALARDLGYTPLYLHYNTGRRIADNGRDLADLLEALLAAWPTRVEALAVLGHSMGGLVARSAHAAGAAAGHAWVERLRQLVFLGTPHHGSPLERGGKWLEGALGVSPYTAPLARLGMLRSAGIMDLRHGNAAPLPLGVGCYALAATRGPRPIGDGLVPLDSALGRHPDPAKTLAFPDTQRWIGRGLGHFDLLDRPEVYQQLRAWLDDRA